MSACAMASDTSAVVAADTAPSSVTLAVLERASWATSEISLRTEARDDIPGDLCAAAHRNDRDSRGLVARPWRAWPSTDKVGVYEEIT
jgi:hypothetical protein